MRILPRKNDRSTAYAHSRSPHYVMQLHASLKSGATRRQSIARKQPACSRPRLLPLHLTKPQRSSDRRASKPKAGAAAGLQRHRGIGVTALSSGSGSGSATFCFKQGAVRAGGCTADSPVNCRKRSKASREVCFALRSIGSKKECDRICIEQGGIVSFAASKRPRTRS